MVFKDYYKILGLETSKISLQELKIAYRDAAKKYHPDVNVGDRIAEERFKDISEAYRILSNSSAKRKYDRIWNRNVGKNINKNSEEDKKVDMKFSDFLGMFFGNSENKKSTTKNKKEFNNGENIETQIDLSIEETFYGCNKKIALRTIGGKLKTFDVKIPAGIRNNEKIRLIGQGKKGINGGKNGDLFIKVNIEDSKKLKLRGINLYTDLCLTPWEAAIRNKSKNRCNR